MNTKLVPIQPTSTDLATAHARRIVKAISDMATELAASYCDHPATSAKVVPDPATKQPISAAARPAVAKADIQGRLGAQNIALVEAILAALAPTTAAAVK